MKKTVFSIAIRLLKFVRPLLSGMIFSISMGIAGHASAIAVMTFAALFLCSAAGLISSFSPTFFGSILLFFAFIRGALHYLEQYKGHDIAFRLLAKIRSDLFKSLRHLAPAKLVEKKSGDIVTSLMADIEIIEVFFAHTIAPVSIAVAMYIILVAFFFTIHPVLGWMMAAFYLLEAVLVPMMSFRFARKSGRQYRRVMSNLNSFLIDSLQGMKELILFGKAADRIENMKYRTVSLHGASASLKKHEGFIAGMNDLLITVASSSILAVGVVLFKSGQISETEVIVSFITAVSSFGSFVAISFLSNTVTNTFAAAERIFAIQDELPLVMDSENAVEMKEEFAPSIRCEKVTFGYKNEVILKDLDFNVKPGCKIAIKGESGSGKTTLLRLLLRFWDTDSGSIKIRNQNIRNVTTGSLRENVSSLSQDTYLFKGTIAENIALGKKNAQFYQIEDAAKKAEIHDFIQTLPDGYDTEVGELGGKLSGGERQRLGIARTILNDADVILLDEMTSSLDVLNESAILKTIKETMLDKTVVTVTHRDTVAKKSDMIFNIKSEEKK